MTVDVLSGREAEALLASGAFLPAPLPEQAPRPGVADLIASARVVNADTDNGVRWTQGFSVLGDTCGPPGVWDVCTDSPGTAPPIGKPAFYKYTPFLLIADYQCSTFGITPQDVHDGAQRMLTGPAASFALAREFWNGVATAPPGGVQNPSVVRNGVDVTPTPGTALRPYAALAELEEQARAKAPGLGRYMIHCSPRVLALWSEGAALNLTGNVITTMQGTIVSADAGYATRSNIVGPPAVAALTAPHEWAAITGVATVRLGSVQQAPDVDLMVDRNANTITGQAARLAAVTYPPCLPPQVVEVDTSLV